MWPNNRFMNFNINNNTNNNNINREQISGQSINSEMPSIYSKQLLLAANSIRTLFGNNLNNNLLNSSLSQVFIVLVLFIYFFNHLSKLSQFFEILVLNINELIIDLFINEWIVSPLKKSLESDEQQSNVSERHPIDYESDHFSRLGPNRLISLSSNIDNRRIDSLNASNDFEYRETQSSFRAGLMNFFFFLKIYF